MAQMALTVAGNYIGSYFGGPLGGMLGSTLGAVAGTLLQNTLDHKKGNANATPNVGANSSWGSPIPIVYGSARCAGQMIWCGPLKNKNVKSGKGSLISQLTSAPTTQCSFAYAFCEGPGQLINIWADGQILYSASVAWNLQYHNTQFYFYPGSETQVADPLVVDWVSKNVPGASDAAPAFRGICYLMFQDVDLSRFGYRIPQISAEICTTPQGYLPELTYTAFGG
jgi:hypothetical protein